jgi:hypothetical protein
MYCFQFMDGSWRIASLTNARNLVPYATPARRLFDGIYATRAAAEVAMRQIRVLLDWA